MGAGHWEHTEGLCFTGVSASCSGKIDPFPPQVCRLRDDEGELIEDNVDMAEQLLKQGLEAFPTSAYLHIVYSSFLLVLRDKMRQSVTMLDKARDLDPDLGQRFQIFVREREFKQQQQGESTGEGAMDLVSYVRRDPRNGIFIGL